MDVSGRVRGGRRVFALATATLCLLAAGCTSVVQGSLQGPADRSTTAAPSPTSSPDFPTSTPAAPTGTATPAAAVSPAQLYAVLMTPPSGSQPWGDAWGKTTFPTVKQFVEREYPPQNVQTVLADFRSEGLTGITHRTWIASNGTQADVMLFAFATPTGALGRYSLAVAAQGHNAGVVSVPLTAGHPAAAFRHTTADSDGYVTGIAYSISGPVVLEIFTYSKKTFDSRSTLGWARTQIARLP